MTVIDIAEDTMVVRRDGWRGICDQRDEANRLRNLAAEQVETLNVQLNERNARVEQLSSRVLVLEQQVVNGRTELTRFKAQTRELLIEGAGQHGWCRAGTNEWLEKLGCDPWYDSFRVCTTIHIDIDVSTCDNESEAEDKARQALYNIQNAIGTTTVSVGTVTINNMSAEANE